MTEFEAATVAYQNASLALQATALETQRLGVWVALGVGVMQSVLIAGGLWLMKKAASHRDALHEENMLALRTLIERTARDPHP